MRINTNPIIHLPLILVFLLTRCSPSNEKGDTKSYEYNLIPTGEILEIPADERTNIESLAMFQYEEGKDEFLTFLNMPNNSIQFYNLKTKKKEKEIIGYEKGPDATGKILGFKVHNYDSIYVCGGHLNEILLLDFDGNIKRKYSYSSVDGKTPNLFTSISRIYTPLIVHKKMLYLTQNLSSELQIKGVDNLPSANKNVCLALKENGEKFYLPMQHPLANLKGQIGFFASFSRDFDGRNFIYSFDYDDDIYVTSDHINVQKFNCSSKFIDDLNFETTADPMSDLSFEKAGRAYIKSEKYWNLAYDRYRKVFYRFVKLEEPYKKGDDIMKAQNIQTIFQLL
jgi:hypothetical protein